jgi:hypothetical protein
MPYCGRVESRALHRLHRLHAPLQHRNTELWTRLMMITVTNVLSGDHYSDARLRGPSQESQKKHVNLETLK